MRVLIGRAAKTPKGLVGALKVILLPPFYSQQFQRSRFPECLLSWRRAIRARICVAPKSMDWLLDRKYPLKILQIFIKKRAASFLFYKFYKFMPCKALFLHKLRRLKCEMGPQKCEMGPQKCEMGLKSSGSQV